MRYPLRYFYRSLRNLFAGLAAEVGFERGGIAQHRLRFAFRQLATVVQHTDAISHGLDDVHIMLDQEQGRTELGSPVAQAGCQFVNFLRGDTRGWLVEQY